MSTFHETKQISDCNTDDMLRSINLILPKSVQSSCIAINQCKSWLFTEEAALIAGATKKRKKEFIAGRTCARIALSNLGFSPCPINIGIKREPIWPEGVCGAITHDGEYCITSVAKKNDVHLIGIDLTSSEPLDQDLIELVCTTEDISEIRRLGKGRLVFDPYKMVFTLKESLFKCLYPLVQELFEFHDVSVIMNPQENIASIQLENGRLFSNVNMELRAKFLPFRQYLFSAVWVEAIH